MPRYVILFRIIINNYLLEKKTYVTIPHLRDLYAMNFSDEQHFENLGFTD